ncbi:unnamed protein product [Brachionus calyciflorus]|uniref:F-box domain-containing protein n=1 Tax=Brachionus calyciflorus TaxID=104777 RepID=A0A814P5Q5_9BILA|nr:unnamed protein product [Brachionus calyciflorus]
MNLDELPYDIMLKILNEIDIKDFGKLCQVNKKLYEISNDEFYWKQKSSIDVHKWNVLYSNKFLNSNYDSLKNFYISNCPEIQTLKVKIVEKSENFQINFNQNNNSLRLSSFFGQVSNYLIQNILGQNQEQGLRKLIMFGPGLETTTSCLVTKMLWNSEFKTLDMIPGKDGYGSGIKMKLFNNNPFNLTILYTNVKKLRLNNKHNMELNRLFALKKNEDQEVIYELQPQVKTACSDANGFVYIIDNIHLKSLIDRNDKEEIENYKYELSVLMREVKQKLPLLILSCSTNQDNKKMNGISCAQIVDALNLKDLDREWCIRDCEIFQDKLKDVALGFEWILNFINQSNSNNEIK